MKAASNYLTEVRDQYENLPYPPRDPKDEHKRLLATWLDDLPMINHYCFGGTQTFDHDFRVLVAGGGTGDGTIYLAEQLRDTNAEIVHLDLSEASIEVAKRRAEIRELGNIRWQHESLLALPELDIGKFDYINCSGVLHHLADPNAGLQALLSVKKPSGALGIMVYGQYGRTGIYQMQALLKLINVNAKTVDEKLETAKSLLKVLPATNWFQRGKDLHHDHVEFGDAGIYDLLLHSQDRAYTVEELYGWFNDELGLNIVFTDVGRGRSPYLPHMLVGPHTPSFLTVIASLPIRQQQAIAELIGGTLAMHCFYATPSHESVAAYGDLGMIPYFFHESTTGPEMSAFIHKNPGPTLLLNHRQTGVSVSVNPGKYGKFILKYIDGKRSFAEIFELVKAEDKFKRLPPTDAELFADFKELYDFFNSIDRMLLKKQAGLPA